MEPDPEPWDVPSPKCPVHNRFMIKRAQGRKRFGMKNFKKRWFRLTNHEFTYQKSKGNKKNSLFPSFHIPLFRGTRALFKSQLGLSSAFLERN